MKDEIIKIFIVGCVVQNKRKLINIKNLNFNHSKHTAISKKRHDDIKIPQHNYNDYNNYQVSDNIRFEFKKI